LQKVILDYGRGGDRHFHLERPLEGPVLQQGELSMICVGLSERDLLQWHDVTRKILGGHWSPCHPPRSTPGLRWKKSILKFENFCLSEFHKGLGTKNRFQQLWMYKTFKHCKHLCIGCLGEAHICL